MNANGKVQKYNNTSSNYNYKWIELLCQHGNKKDFANIRYNSKCTTLAIMKYRRKLRECGYGNVSFIELNKAHSDKQYGKLHSLLEYMFLEPISLDWFEYAIDKIDNTVDGLNKLYNMHLQDKNVRILSIILVL